MTNVKVSSSWSSETRDKQSQSVVLPRCPFPTSSSSRGDERPKSFHIDEQPPWLDDLLNESETPAKRSIHRRAFSDSSPMLGGSNFYSSITNLNVEEGGQKGDTSSSLWGLNGIDSNLGDGKRQDQQELVQEANCSSKMKEDSKSDKKQFARHSRIRKLQYIAELEMIVQGLQAQSLQISAELEFLDRQNLILNLENRSLRQRLDNLSHQRLIKHVQHEMLEQEAAHLRTLYQRQQLQQQQQQQPSPAHTRSSLFFNHKDMPSRI